MQQRSSQPLDHVRTWGWQVALYSLHDIWRLQQQRLLCCCCSRWPKRVALPDHSVLLLLLVLVLVLPPRQWRLHAVVLRPLPAASNHQH